MLSQIVFKHQREAADQMKTGSILCGGVGSGKSRTAILYYFEKECGGVIRESTDISPMKTPKDLYIITTAAKRDTLDWERECANFNLSRDRMASVNGIKVVVDSWNNIKKYVEVSGCFFIFDEQRVVGSGSWVKSFLKITKRNNWVLLSATPGDTWLDYVPVFIANGFYRNRTEFLRSHVVYNTFTKFPKVDHYVDEGRLRRQRDLIVVNMEYKKPSERVNVTIFHDYDIPQFNMVYRHRKNPFTGAPIKEISSLCFMMRRVSNSHPSRIKTLVDLLTKHKRLIIFYNFNYELNLLKESLTEIKDLTVSEYNGHKHDQLPKTDSWAYLVQYTSGSEGWNCIETNAMVFYSLNYSYRTMLQAAGRIDRLNTGFKTLYYYTLVSNSPIDQAISSALEKKENFNEDRFNKEELIPF